MGEEATKYRAVVARANFLAADRVDIQFAVKEATRCMAKPRDCDWQRLKRIGRYLLGNPRVILQFESQFQPSSITVYSDSDFAGCKRTRKSTSGFIIMHGNHCIRTGSKTQSLIALSSGEAELYALVKACSEGLGIQSLSKDFNRQLEIRTYTDASAALGIVGRKGLGKLRHVDTQFLWVQAAAARKSIEFSKLPGSENPSDICTKGVESWRLSEHLLRINVFTRSDRAVSAPTLQ